MNGKGHALSRDELIRVLTAYSGVTTENGEADGTTLVDINLKNNPSISEHAIKEKTILIMSGDAIMEDKGAASFVNATGTITLQGTGFSAQIKAGTTFRILNISSVEIDVARIEAKVDGSIGYAELSATGTTTNDYADALDIDARLYNEFTIKIKNTDGAGDSLDYRVLLRPEHGVAEQMIQPEDIAIADGDYDFINIDHKWGQVIVQVKATLADNQATYSIYAICNKQ